MLRELLKRNADEIVERWFQDGLAAYHMEAIPALTRQQDRFANPLGTSLRQGTCGIFEAIAQGADDETVREALDDIVRMRAVQQMPPSEALGFIFRLKDHIRTELGDDLGYPGVRRELEELDRRVDEIGLLAFDLFMSYRERVFELRMNEVKRTAPYFVGRMAPAGREESA